MAQSIEKDGKVFLLAYDQGMEHGPVDFNEQNYHPNFITKIAIKGGASCVAMGYGLARRFYSDELAKQMPLVLKLNMKSALYSGNNVSALVAGVDEAVDLGASAVGFTVFPGQEDERIGVQQFAIVRKHAEEAGLPTVLWSYARGPEIEDQYDSGVVAYAARVGAELGADYVKVKYPGLEALPWVNKVALQTKVLISGTGGFGENYPAEVKKVMEAGATGLAVGRKIWQDDDPISLAQKVSQVIFG